MSKTSKPRKSKASLDLNDESEPVNGFEQDAKSAKAGKAKPVVKTETVKAGKAKPVVKTEKTPGRPSRIAGRTLAVGDECTARKGSVAEVVVSAFIDVRTVEKAVTVLKTKLEAVVKRSEQFTKDPDGYIIGYIRHAIKQGWLVDAK